MSDGVFYMFDTLTPETIPLNRPVGGTTYLFKWEDNARKDDWRADGYHWRQNGTFKKLKNGRMSKTYFRVMLIPVFVHFFYGSKQVKRFKYCFYKVITIFV